MKMWKTAMRENDRKPEPKEFTLCEYQGCEISHSKKILNSCPSKYVNK